MTVKIAFSGSRGPLTKFHGARIITLLEALPQDTLVITGGCIGVDAYVARIAKELRLKVYTVIPGNTSKLDPNWQLYCDGFEQLDATAPQPYRERNKRLIELSDALIALPMFDEDHARSKRSGTWQTIRMGRDRSHKEYYPMFIHNFQPRMPTERAITASNNWSIFLESIWIHMPSRPVTPREEPEHAEAIVP